MVGLACFIVMLWVCPEAQTDPEPPPPTTPAVLIEQAGFPRKHWDELLDIVACESGGNAQARNLNTKGKWAGTEDVGLWQINTTIWAELVATGDPYDPQDNTRMAKIIYDIQGLDAWVCHRL